MTRTPQSTPPPIRRLRQMLGPRLFRCRILYIFLCESIARAWIAVAPLSSRKATSIHRRESAWCLSQLPYHRHPDHLCSLLFSLSKLVITLLSYFLHLRFLAHHEFLFFTIETSIVRPTMSRCFRCVL
ncbi:hypothetical protein F5146DRAFT_188614 [Armillaria mellea]|nr:hypothetical protein F5146DRAFT_188614 [Armillaria mellea]